MGYYTDFKVSSKDILPKEYQQQLEEISSYNFHDDGNELLLLEAKWYDHDTHMAALSLLYPNVLFSVEGEGEESGDLWKAYYKNGKSQTCEAIITFEPYDEGKMK